MIAICLSDGPRTVAEIEKQFIAFPRRFGLFIELFDQESIDRGDLTQDLLSDLEKMKEAGWVERREERYALTPLGHEEAAERLAGLQSGDDHTQARAAADGLAGLTGCAPGTGGAQAPCGFAFGQCGPDQRCYWRWRS
jgi:hypothetical protein